MPSANRTVSRTCRTQYSGSHHPVPASAPVTVDTTGSTGSRNTTEESTARYSAIIGSINSEWKA